MERGVIACGALVGQVGLVRSSLMLLLLAAPALAEPLPTAMDAGWKGAKLCEPLFENDRLRAARCSFPSGVGHERHFHPPHWGYVVEGTTMRITSASGTEDRVLKPGTSWWSDGIEWHEALNVGTTTGVYVIVEPQPAP